MWKRVMGWWRRRRERRRVWKRLYHVEGQLRLAEQVIEAMQVDKKKLSQQYLLIWDELDRCRRMAELERGRAKENERAWILWLARLAVAVADEGLIDVESAGGVWQVTVKDPTVRAAEAELPTPIVTITAAEGDPQIVYTVSGLAPEGSQGCSA